MLGGLTPPARQFGQVHPVILGDAGGDGVAAGLEVVGGQLAGVGLGLLALPPGPQRVQLVADPLPGGPVGRGPRREVGRLPLPVLLLAVRLGRRRRRPEHHQDALGEPPAGGPGVPLQVDRVEPPPLQVVGELGLPLGRALPGGGRLAQRDLGGGVRLLAAVAVVGARLQRLPEFGEFGLEHLGRPLGLFGGELRGDPPGLGFLNARLEPPGLDGQQVEPLAQLAELLALAGGPLLDLAGLAGEHPDLGVGRLDRAAGGVGPAAEFGQLDLGGGHLGREGAGLGAEVAQLALAGDEADLGGRRADGEGAVRFEQFAGAGDESEPGVCGGEPAGVGEVVGEQDVAEQPVGEPGQVAGDE